jgi:hypothetical protein
MVPYIQYISFQDIIELSPTYAHGKFNNYHPSNGPKDKVTKSNENKVPHTGIENCENIALKSCKY